MDLYLLAAAEPMSQTETIAWAAAVATGVATVITAAMMFWFRIVDTPRPAWEMVPQGTKWDAPSEYSTFTAPTGACSISNAGTGNARRVSFIGVGVELTLGKAENLLQRGGRFSVAEPGFETSVYLKYPSYNFDDAFILLTWTEPSRFLFPAKKHRAFRLSEHFEQPALEGDLMNQDNGEFVRAPVEMTPALQKQISKVDTELEKTGIDLWAKPNWFLRRKQWRKLSKAGWGWKKEPSKPEQK